MPVSLAPRSLLTPAAPLQHHAVTFPLKVQFGACCGCSDGGRADADKCQSPCQPAICEESESSNVSRWYFGVSTGHAASTTFSSKMCFDDDREHTPISWQFEANHNYGDRRKAHSSHGLKTWYEGLLPLNASGSPSTVGSATASLVSTVLVPDMLLKATGHKTVVDLGHHVNLGLLEPLVAQLNPQVRFIRIIRSRFDTVRSFMGEDKVPCSQTEGMYTLCPLKHPEVALPVSRLTWAKLSDMQRVLWLIDEVEARWQRLRRAHPILPHLTVNWCTGEQLAVAWRAVADFIGEGHLSPKACPPRVHDKYDVSDEELSVQDAQYQSIMNYSLPDLEMLRDVQRPHDCVDRPAGLAAPQRAHRAVLA